VEGDEDDEDVWDRRWPIMTTRPDGNGVSFRFEDDAVVTMTTKLNPGRGDEYLLLRGAIPEASVRGAKLTFYRYLDVTDDAGDKFSFDLLNAQMQGLVGGHGLKALRLEVMAIQIGVTGAPPGENDKLIGYADPIAFCTVKSDGRILPKVVHGFLDDLQDIGKEGKTGKAYLAARRKERKPVLGTELVNCPGVQSSPAECVEGLVWAWASEGERDLRAKAHGESGGDEGDHFFCTSAWDPTKGAAVNPYNVANNKLYKWQGQGAWWLAPALT